jgi:hypothetical protein
MKMYRNKKSISMSVRFIWLALSLVGTVDLWSQTVFQHDSNGNQISTSSNGANLCDDGTTANRSFEFSNSIVKVFPNPSSGDLRIYLNIEEADVYNLLVYNEIGQLVFSPIRNERLNVGEHLVAIPPTLSKGMFFVTLSSKSGSMTRKIVFQ